MKKNILYIGIYFLTLSCTVDDSVIIEESDFYGDWGLISAESNREIDYNYDGNTSTDIREDLSCFTVQLKLNPNKTFSEVIIDRPVVDNDLDCIISERNGNWGYTKESNLIVFNYLDDNNNIIGSTNSFKIGNIGRFELEREFTDDKGSFKANLEFIFINN